MREQKGSNYVSYNIRYELIYYYSLGYIIDAYYFAESFNWYSFDLEKHS